MLSGCGMQTEEKTEHQAVKTYKAYLTKSIDAIEKVYTIMDKYAKFDSNPEFKEEVAKNGGVDILDAYKFLPNSSLALMGVDGQSNPLENELNQLVEEFQREIEEIAPDPTPALSLPGVELGNDGELVIGGDMVISPKTLDGALTIELMNAQARGEDIDAILEDLDAANEEIASEYGGVIYDKDDINNDGTIDTKGFYMRTLRRWQNGVIRYYWGDISEGLKDATLEAMRDWEEKTEGAVSFVEITDPIELAFAKYVAMLFLAGLLEISEDADLDSLGNAHVGVNFGISKMKLRPDILYDEDVLKRVPRHELGHVLGLKHEHQRGDRNSYINVNWSKVEKASQYEKIDFWITVTIQKLKWRIITIRIFGMTIYIDVPYFAKETVNIARKSYAPTPYDYFSIMHYSGDGSQKILTFKKNATNIINGVTNIYKTGDSIPYNKEISKYDIETIQILY